MTLMIGMPWKFQFSWMQVFKERPKDAQMQASRNGYFFVPDGTTGKNLLTAPFTYVNWALAREYLRPRDPAEIQDKEPKPNGVLVAPDEHGGAPTIDRRVLTASLDSLL